MAKTLLINIIQYYFPARVIPCTNVTSWVLGGWGENPPTKNHSKTNNIVHDMQSIRLRSLSFYHRKRIHITI